jgi:hypothetical protein
VVRAIVAEGLDDSKPTDKEIATLKWHQEPRFDESTPNHVTVILGKSARLPCRVLNLGERAVRAMDGRKLTFLPYSFPLVRHSWTSQEFFYLNSVVKIHIFKSALS